MSNMEVKVIADSINPSNKRITTLQLKYPRFIHAEFMTHRVFSRNASSSRAIPVKKILSQVWNDPAMPVHWGMNQAGMQANSELSGFKKYMSKLIWKTSGKVACMFAWTLMKLNLHKQVANRILEPWQHIHVVVTATEWDNFFLLRLHADAQPEIRELAMKMYHAMENSSPVKLKFGQWHLPYVDTHEVHSFKQHGQFENALRCSAARCARVSYLKHDGGKPSLKDDLTLYDRLITSKPAHMSPVEHQAQCINNNDQFGNFVGWKQFRKNIEQEGQ